VVSRAGAVAGSFDEAARKLLRQLAGWALSTSTVERVTEATGQRRKELRQQGHTVGPKVLWSWHRDRQGRTVAYVSADATGLGMQGPDARRADGRMAYVGMVYNPPPEAPAAAPERRPRRQRMAARYLAGLYTLEELGAQLRRLAAQVGMEQADLWLALTDGANGLDRLMQQHFGRADLVLILDFWHAAVHLADLARALYGPDEARVQATLQQWCQVLQHEGGARLLALLEALAREDWSAEVVAVWEQETGYVRKNVERMDYPRHVANGWQIGSGPVASACKTVVGRRMKGGGMRWGEDGADAVCPLRALFKSEGDQWEAFRPPN
jgi:hypothetical protein